MVHQKRYMPSRKNQLERDFQISNHHWLLLQGCITIVPANRAKRNKIHIEINHINSIIVFKYLIPDSVGYPASKRKVNSPYICSSMPNDKLLATP